MSSEFGWTRVACRDLEISTAWFADLFNRAPDDRPGEHAVEWHYEGGGRLQLVRDAETAGTGSLALMISGIATGRETIANLAGDAGHTTVQLNDPDGNVVLLAAA